MIDKNNLLRSRLEDYVEDSYSENDYVKFSDFLDEFECSVVIEFFKSICFENYILFGGYEQASRKMLAVFSDDTPNNFPFEILKLQFSNKDYLNHRNILGALMNLNIARSTIGDICLIDEQAYIFSTTAAAVVIKNELEYVGRSKILISEAEPMMDYSPKKVSEQYVISSERLDCIISAVTNCSRNKAEELISSSFVFVNGAIEKNSSKKIKENSKISVRGFGKFEITDLSERTRRDKIKLKIFKFI